MIIIIVKVVVVLVVVVVAVAVVVVVVVIVLVLCGSSGSGNGVVGGSASSYIHLGKCFIHTTSFIIHSRCCDQFLFVFCFEC